MINLDNLFASAGYNEIYFDNQLVDKVYFDGNLVYDRCVKITLPSNTITSAFSAQTYSVINEDTLTTGITESVSSSNATNYYRVGKNVYIKPTSTPKRIIKVGNVELPYHNSSTGALTTATTLSTAKSIGSFSTDSVLAGTLSNYIVSCSLSYDSSISSRGRISAIQSDWGQSSGSYTGTFYTKGGSTLTINYLASNNANTALYSQSSSGYSLLSAPPTSVSSLALRSGLLSVPNTTSSFSTKLLAVPFYWFKISNKTGKTLSINNQSVANNATSTVSWYNVGGSTYNPSCKYPDLTNSYIALLPSITCPSYVTYSWSTSIGSSGASYSNEVEFSINTTSAGTRQVVPSITLLSSSSSSYPAIWSVYANSAGKFADSYIDLKYAGNQRTYFMPTNRSTFYYKPTNAATTINNNGYIKVTFDGEEYYIVDKTYSSSETDTRATAAPCGLNSSPQRGDRYTLTSSSVYPAADYVYVWVSKGGLWEWTVQVSNRLPFAITVQYTSTKVTGQSTSGVTLSTVTIAGGTYDNPSQKNVTIKDVGGTSDKYVGFSVIRWYPTTTGLGSDYLSRQYKWFYVTDGGVAEILTT